MSDAPEDLLIYLNDHLAGSVAALELLQHLIETVSEDLREMFEQLFREIEADQAELEVMIVQLGGAQSKTRQAAAWLLEKIGWAKFNSADFRQSQFGLFQALEGLSLGILGKRALWLALSKVPRCEKHDLTRLIRRAEEQFGRVEAQRIRIAEQALAASKSVQTTY